MKMKLQMFRKGENIVSNKDFTDIKDSGEIAHFIVELEIIKQELLEIWGKYENESNNI